MANDYSTKVWIVDTIGATSFYRDYVHIKTIYWKAPTTAGDVLTILQANGHPLLEAVCEVNGQSQVWNLDNKYSGLQVTAMTHGTLEIHIK